MVCTDINFKLSLIKEENIVRLFTAIKLSNEIKQHIQQVQAQLKKEFTCKKWQKNR
jgi:hypothetical protein